MLVLVHSGSQNSQAPGSTAKNAPSNDRYPTFSDLRMASTILLILLLALLLLVAVYWLTVIFVLSAVLCSYRCTACTVATVSSIVFVLLYRLYCCYRRQYSARTAVLLVLLLLTAVLCSYCCTACTAISILIVHFHCPQIRSFQNDRYYRIWLDLRSCTATLCKIGWAFIFLHGYGS